MNASIQSVGHLKSESQPLPQDSPTESAQPVEEALEQVKTDTLISSPEKQVIEEPVTILEPTPIEDKVNDTSKVPNDEVKLEPSTESLSEQVDEKTPAETVVTEKLLTKE